MLLKSNTIEKTFGQNHLFTIPSLTIYNNDKIGLIGKNGSGKTTLFNILTQKIQPDKGSVTLNTDYHMVEQLEASQSLLSGGEITNEKLKAAFNGNSSLLFLDEPTNHLDYKNIDYLKNLLHHFHGAYILISHNRDFLNDTCTQIWELDNGQLKIYKGNYEAYSIQKKESQNREEKEYEAYLKEKEKLRKMIQGQKEKTAQVKKTPKRMGTSEARLHKMGNQRATSKLEKNIEHLEKRLEQLDIKAKPKHMKAVKIPLNQANKLYGNTVIIGHNIHMAFDKKTVFHNLNFTLKNKSKTALIGRNGSGKTTLLEMIINDYASIHKKKHVKIGYFSQHQKDIDLKKTVLENMLNHSIFDETTTRRLLGNLLFSADDMDKKAFVLSGGERNKLAIAMLLTNDINVLILDEPTNHLDIPSIEALETALKNYEGTLLFVTHDKGLVKNIATEVWEIEDEKIIITTPTGQRQHNKSLDKIQKENNRLLLNNRLSALSSLLTAVDSEVERKALEADYQTTLKELKGL